MTLELSKRLEMVAGLVTPGGVLADIGTDHAYLPIWLCRNGKIRSAIAMDVAKGPLMHAEQSIRRYRMEDRISTRLSDGLRALAPHEADTAVLAGMGGALTIRILQDSLPVARSLRELVLQPQSEIAAVRHFLYDQGLWPEDEDMVREDGKYYTAMKISISGDISVSGRVPASGSTPITGSMPVSDRTSGSGCRKNETGDMLCETPVPDEAEFWYGPVLLRKHPPVLEQYLEWDRRRMQAILESLEKASGDEARILERKKEVTEGLRRLERARQYFPSAV